MFDLNTQNASYINNQYSDKLPVPAKLDIKEKINESKYDMSGKYMTIQSFWLNNSYILKQIKDLIKRTKK